MSKTLSRDDYLKALALFTVAKQHATESRRFEKALCELLGFEEEYAGNISDALYEGLSFDKALAAEGFIAPSVTELLSEPVSASEQNRG